MKKVLTSNLGLKILSVLVACVIWIVVANEDDPEKIQSFSDVAVEIRNSDCFGVDKTFRVEDDTDKVKIWVKARKSVLSRLQAKDFKVVADMRNLTLGDAVPYTIECSSNAITKANWECEPASMKVKIENIVQESFGVEVVIEGNGKPAEGYAVGATSVREGDTINIAGAESLVNIIHKVSVPVSVNSTMDSDQVISGDITITDGNGVPFTKNQLDNLIFTTSSGVLLKDRRLNAEIDLWKVQPNIKIDVGTTGTPAWGYRVSSVKVTPETVSIAGDEETLEKLEGVLEIPDMISVAGATESFTPETINLADYLKEHYKDKLKLEGGSASAISVKVVMEKIGTKKMEIPLSEITIKGKPEELDMVLTPADKISIEVGAVSARLEDLRLTDVDAVLDLTAYQEAGRYEVPVEITLPQGYAMEQEIVIVVNLTEKEAAEEIVQEE